MKNGNAWIWNGLSEDALSGILELEPCTNMAKAMLRWVRAVPITWIKIGRWRYGWLLAITNARCLFGEDSNLEKT